MDSFFDLENSTDFSEKMIFLFVTKLVNELFDKSDNIIIEQECETEKNHQYINSQWKTLELYFKIPKRILGTQKFVRQTMKYILEYLNEKYQFKRLIRWEPVTKTVRLGQTTCSKSYTAISF